MGIPISANIAKSETVRDWISINDALPEVGKQVLFTSYTDEAGWEEAETGEWTGRRSQGDTLVMDYGNEPDWYSCEFWMPIPPYRNPTVAKSETVQEGQVIKKVQMDVHYITLKPT